MLPAPGATEYIDSESKGAYSFDPVKRIVNTYDNKDSMMEKIKIIHEKGLAGMIIWEIAGDIKDFEHPRCLRRFLMENLTHGNPPTSPLAQQQQNHLHPAQLRLCLSQPMTTLFGGLRDYHVSVYGLSFAFYCCGRSNCKARCEKLLVPPPPLPGA
jgi:hypothetical protein